MTNHKSLIDVAASLDLNCLFFYKRKGKPKIDQGRVVRKPVNVNPGLIVNVSIIFSCSKMCFTTDIWCSLRLLQLKTEGPTI